MYIYIYIYVYIGRERDREIIRNWWRVVANPKTYRVHQQAGGPEEVMV